MAEPMVDVVVLNWNGPELVFAFMDHLLRSDPGCRYRLVMVDNGSTEPVWTALRWYRANTRRLNPFRKKAACDLVIARHGTNLGFSGGCNAGARMGTAPWILFLNNDAFPETERWLLRLVTTGERTGAGAVGPCGDRVLGLQQHRWSHPQYDWPDIHPAKFLSGYAMLVRRDVLHGLGGFDESFFNGDEDLDLSIRIRRAGHPLYIDRTVFVRHANQTSMDRWAKAQGMKDAGEQYQRTRHKLHMKWGEWQVNDLFSWNEYRLPVSWWPHLGVLPNGFAFGRKGGAREQVAQLAELSSGFGREEWQAGAAAPELLSGRSGTHGYARDDDTHVRWFGGTGTGCACDFCRAKVRGERPGFLWAGADGVPAWQVARSEGGIRGHGDAWRGFRGALTGALKEE